VVLFDVTADNKAVNQQLFSDFMVNGIRCGPDGVRCDVDGNLYCAASLEGRKGVVRIPTNTSADDRKAELFVSGPSIVGLAFTPSKAMVVATTNALYRVDVGVRGRMNW
jgi:sugar lactone lactonase YvrE